MEKCNSNYQLKMKLYVKIHNLWHHKNLTTENAYLIKSNDNQRTWIKYGFSACDKTYVHRKQLLIYNDFFNHWPTKNTVF